MRSQLIFLVDNPIIDVSFSLSRTLAQVRARFSGFFTSVLRGQTVLQSLALAHAIFP